MSPNVNSSSVERMMAKKQLRTVFQPIVDLNNGKVFAYEALARSDAPEFKNPLVLFDVAIKEGVCGKLGRTLRELAIEGCPNHQLFLNIHPNEFDEHWLVQPDDPIFAHEMNVFLEITESVPLSHFERCHSILKEIRGKGIHLVVDDLGAGYSNLKYIADLNPEVVKLDRVLIAGLSMDARLRKLVTSIVKLCEDLGAQVVAEGIETEGELSAVREAKVRFAQGYLLARPGFPPPPIAAGEFAPKRRASRAAMPPVSRGAVPPAAKARSVPPPKRRKTRA